MRGSRGRQLDVSFQHEQSHLVATVCGEWEPTAITEVLTLIRDKAQQTASSRILIDAFNLRPPSIEFYRFLAGQDLAVLFPFSLKVAVLGRAEQITKFGENVAVNRGARVLVCSEKTEALRWLLEGLPTQATSNDKA